MKEIYGGHIVAKHLKQIEGIETVFSLSGGHIDIIFDGFLEYGIKLVDVRHEQAAVMMAHAWSVMKAEPSVCILTAGPGFTNALTGIVNAYLENAPIVVICGTAPIRDWGKGALQEMNQEVMINPVVKWTGRCYDIKRIPEYISVAFRYAVSGRPGPVFLELPPDILFNKVNEDEIVYPQKGNLKYTVMPNKEVVQKAAEVINTAKTPLLLTGSGVAYSKCDDELRDFIEKTGMPFILMNNSRGTIPDNHELSIWHCGLTGLITALSQADVIVSIGIRYNWVLIFGQPLQNAKLIRIDIEPTEINRNITADIGIVGDAGAVLKMLNVEIRKNDHGEWIENLGNLFSSLTENDVKLMQEKSDPIHPFRLMNQIREAMKDEDVIYITDGGDTSYFAMMGLRATERSSLIGSGTLFGCLGTGLPFGIGAKLARADKKVVVVSGDGSFGFNVMEFETAVRHNIPIICVICNDQAWGMIKHGQELSYGSNKVIGSDLGVVHYEKVVEALGGYGELVTKDDEINPAIKRAIQSNKPSCINVLTDPTVTSPATMMFVSSLKMD